MCCRSWNARGYSQRHLVRVVGGQHQIFATFALETDVRERHLPGINDGARKLLPMAAGGRSRTIGPSSLVLKKT